MKIDWRTFARTAAAVAATQINHPELMLAESSIEHVVDTLTKPGATVEEKADAVASTAVQLLQTAEGVSGKDFADDVEVQRLAKGVHDAILALAKGLKAKKPAPALAKAGDIAGPINTGSIGD